MGIPKNIKLCQKLLKKYRDGRQNLNVQDAHSMEFVQSLSDIEANMRTLDAYLDNKCESTYSFALERIKEGVCFIAVKRDDGYRFYPSRFMGYAGNTKSKHDNNDYKDGKKTNPVITKVLGIKLSHSAELEREYRNYCEKLGFVANDKGAFGVERKYWELV